MLWSLVNNTDILPPAAWAGVDREDASLCGFIGVEAIVYCLRNLDSTSNNTSYVGGLWVWMSP